MRYWFLYFQFLVLNQPVKIAKFWNLNFLWVLKLKNTNINMFLSLTGVLVARVLSDLSVDLSLVCFRACERCVCEYTHALYTWRDVISSRVSSGQKAAARCATHTMCAASERPGRARLPNALFSRCGLRIRETRPKMPARSKYEAIFFVIWSSEYDGKEHRGWVNKEFCVCRWD